MLCSKVRVKSNRPVRCGPKLLSVVAMVAIYDAAWRTNKSSE